MVLTIFFTLRSKYLSNVCSISWSFLETFSCVFYDFMTLIYMVKCLTLNLNWCLESSSSSERFSDILLVSNLTIVLQSNGKIGQYKLVECVFLVLGILIIQAFLHRVEK